MTTKRVLKNTTKSGAIVDGESGCKDGGLEKQGGPISYKYAKKMMGPRRKKFEGILQKVGEK